MGDTTNLVLGESRPFKQRSLNLLSISTAKKLEIEMPPSAAAAFEGELSNVQRSYPGEGVMRCVW